MREIKLPKKRLIKRDSNYIEYDKGFNHALMVCKDMARKQGLDVKEMEQTYDK